ncbi:MAG: hypothetical protein IT427_05390 [Pirellulales bacterium]|nr:hypothetical protein [Pirellulales bacterium]
MRSPEIYFGAVTRSAIGRPDSTWSWNSKSERMPGSKRNDVAWLSNFEQHSTSVIKRGKICSDCGHNL